MSRTCTVSPASLPMTRRTAAVTASLWRPSPSAMNDVTGDVASGARVYQASGCASCHTIQGRGGAFGPDLTDVGARSSPAFLRESLLDAVADVPTGFMQVRAVTREGQRLTGVRVNEDPFSIQFRDVKGALYSFFKNELAEFARDEGKTPMPSYRDRLTTTALDDLVAYLVSLEGSR